MPGLNRDKHVLEILPNNNTVSSDDTLKSVAGMIDPMKAKLALREMRGTSEGGMLIFANSTADLERLVTEVNRSDLAKDHSVTRRRNPEIVIFGIKPDITGTK